MSPRRSIRSRTPTSSIRSDDRREHRCPRAGNQQVNGEHRTILYDGEERAIGGLYATVDQETREGIPFLKDLPWWFFGIAVCVRIRKQGQDEARADHSIEGGAAPTAPAPDREQKNEQDILNEKRRENMREYEKK